MIISKSLKRIGAILFAAMMVLSLASCAGAKSEDYDSYIGYQYGGNDPWGNILTVTLMTMDNGNVSFTFTDAIGEGEDSYTFYADDLTGQLKNGVIDFNAKGISIENENETFDYSGTITLKDGKLIVEFKDGQAATISENGDSGSMHVGALEDKDKVVTLSRDPIS